ncbi:MAG: DUF4956 domain-containing protein [Deltaproteobacteria bacterium]
MNPLIAALERSANTTTPTNAVGAVLVCVLLSLVLGQVIAWTYMATHSGLSYSRSFTQSIVLLTLIVSLVMLVIGNNIITAFGLIGALAIIRFRNVLKDTRDTVFVFLSLIIGMAIGSGKYVTAVSSTLATALVILYLHYSGFGSTGHFDGHLSFAAPGGSTEVGDHFRILDRFCRTSKRVSVRQTGTEDMAEYIFEVKLKKRDESQQMLDELNNAPQVTNVALVLRDHTSEV